VCESRSRARSHDGSVPRSQIGSKQQALAFATSGGAQGIRGGATACINRPWRAWSELGSDLALRSVTVRKANAAQRPKRLPELARRVSSDLLSRCDLLDQRIEGYDREIEAQARLSEPACGS
jgi:hypothetical protein